MIVKDQLQEIKDSLPHGALKRIQKKANVDYTTVLRFFEGKSENEYVMLAVMAEYNEVISKKEKFKSFLKQA